MGWVALTGWVEFDPRVHSILFSPQPDRTWPAVNNPNIKFTLST